MSLIFYFALTLFVKMTVTAAFVLAATVTAERVGPLIGGLVATLPISAGPSTYSSRSTTTRNSSRKAQWQTLAINAVNVIFALTYAMLAQTQSRAISMAVACLVWLILGSGVAFNSLDIYHGRVC